MDPAVMHTYENIQKTKKGKKEFLAQVVDLLECAKELEEDEAEETETLKDLVVSDIGRLRREHADEVRRLSEEIARKDQLLAKKDVAVDKSPQSFDINDVLDVGLFFGACVVLLYLMSI